MVLGVKFLNLGLRQNDRDINRRIKKFEEWGNNYVSKKIQNAEANIEANPTKTPDNIIEAIVLNNRKAVEDDKIDNQSILEEFKNFMLAGTDTTSHYIQAIIGYLCLNPESEKLLREEIEREIGEDLSFDNLKKLKYL